MRMVLIFLGIVGILVIGCILFGLSLMGDRASKIEIQNGDKKDLILKTFLITNLDKVLTVDSIHLKLGQKIEIGSCINCSTIDSLDIDYFGIGFYDKDMNYNFKKGQELIHYLSTLDKIGCSTYVYK